MATQAAAQAPAAQPAPQHVSLGELNPRQLTGLIQDLEQTQYEALANGKKRFETSLQAMEDTHSATSNQVLIPMTASVYQEGILTDPSRYIVDIGAGYHIERNIKQHRPYFQKRITQIAANLKNISSVMYERKMALEQARLMLQKKIGETSAASN